MVQINAYFVYVYAVFNIVTDRHRYSDSSRLSSFREYFSVQLDWSTVWAKHNQQSTTRKQKQKFFKKNSVLQLFFDSAL